MVEYTIDLDQVFSSLGNATRREILNRVMQRTITVGELADAFKHLSFAAVAKHVGVLEQAQLVSKKREGKYQFISANPKTLNAATTALQHYQAMWDARFNTLDELLK